jgi:hypothetical protein
MVPDRCYMESNRFSNPVFLFKPAFGSFVGCIALFASFRSSTRRRPKTLHGRILWLL